MGRTRVPSLSPERHPLPSPPYNTDVYFFKHCQQQQQQQQPTMNQPSPSRPHLLPPPVSGLPVVMGPKSVDFEFLECLGSGTYGKVYKVRRRSDGLVAVLKRVPLEGLSEWEQLDTLNESRVMSQLRHERVIDYLESFMEEGHLNIVMEFAEGGDLSHLIQHQQKEGRLLDEDTVWKYLIQIAEGLQCLHDQRILHRDIKGQNIFLDKDMNVKIGDLGLGRIMGPQSCFAYTAVGTPLYFSPEICEEKRYNEKSDIWVRGWRRNAGGGSGARERERERAEKVARLVQGRW